jgi:hypothetical protein
MATVRRFRFRTSWPLQRDRPGIHHGWYLHGWYPSGREPTQQAEPHSVRDIPDSTTGTRSRRRPGSSTRSPKRPGITVATATSLMAHTHRRRCPESSGTKTSTRSTGFVASSATELTGMARSTTREAPALLTHPSFTFRPQAGPGTVQRPPSEQHLTKQVPTRRRSRSQLHRTTTPRDTYADVTVGPIPCNSRLQQGSQRVRPVMQRH